MIWVIAWFVIGFLSFYIPYVVATDWGADADEIDNKVLFFGTLSGPIGALIVLTIFVGVFRKHIRKD